MAAATNVSGQIRLTWVVPASTGGSAITDYIIQRSPNGSSSWATINDGVRSTTGYTVTGLANGTRYYFRVFARNAAGQSPASNVVSGIPRTITVPGALSYFDVYSDYSGFYLYWGDPVSTGGSPLTEFVIQYYDYDDGSWLTLGYAEPWQRDEFVDAPGYGCGRFRIAAVNAVGVGPYSAPVEACYLGDAAQVDPTPAEGPSKRAPNEMVPAGPWVEASGVPVCDTATGVTTVTWTVSNPADAAVRVFDSLLVFGPDGVDIGPGASATATSTMVGPARAVIDIQRLPQRRRGRRWCRRRSTSRPVWRRTPSSSSLPAGPWVEAVWCAGVLHGDRGDDGDVDGVEPRRCGGEGVRLAVGVRSRRRRHRAWCFGDRYVDDGGAGSRGDRYPTTSTTPAWSRCVSPTVDVPACVAAGTPSSSSLPVGPCGGGVWCAGV